MPHCIYHCFPARAPCPRKPTPSLPQPVPAAVTPVVHPWSIQAAALSCFLKSGSTSVPSPHKGTQGRPQQTHEQRPSQENKAGPALKGTQFGGARGHDSATSLFSVVAHRVVDGLGQVLALGCREAGHGNAAVKGHVHVPAVSHVLHLGLRAGSGSGRAGREAVLCADEGRAKRGRPCCELAGSQSRGRTAEL